MIIAYSGLCCAKSHGIVLELSLFFFLLVFFLPPFSAFLLLLTPIAVVCECDANFIHTGCVSFSQFVVALCMCVYQCVCAVHKRHFNKWNASCFHFILILVIRFFSFVVDVVAGFSADVFNSFVLVSVKVH